MDEQGKVQIFTGEGKGKTTAAVGLAWRAVGRGLKVFMVQFLKAPETSGEQFMAEALGTRFTIKPMGRKGFIRRRGCDPLDAMMAARALDEARMAMVGGEYDLIILDEINNHHVSFHTRQTPTAIEKNTKDTLKLFTHDSEFEADIVIFALGVKPNTKLAEKIGIVIGASGAIQVNAHQQTSNENVYSVGDCCEVFHRISKNWVYLPLGDVANRQGRVAGRNIGGDAFKFPGVVGSQSFKIFDLEVATTGLDETEAKNCGYNPTSRIVWGTPVARALSANQKLGLNLSSAFNARCV